jgi:hypothetical protein
MKALLAVLVLGLVAGTGCSHLPGGAAKASASASAAPTGPKLAKAGDWLDAEVPMPPGFPADVPVYSGSRLTAGAEFASSGEVAWGMQWETRDPQTKVQPFFEKQFAQGDWTIHPVSSTTNVYSATIARKSNSHFAGTLVLDYNGTNGKILLSLVSPSG